MKTSKLIGYALLPLGIVAALVIGYVVAERISLSRARPPKDLKRFEEFQAWKRGKIISEGTFQNSVGTYRVFLAPAGRLLASGPSAYLFDDQGRFIDWTPDTGDVPTIKNRFDLTSGNIKITDETKR